MALTIDAQDVAQAVIDELKNAPAGTFTLSPIFERVSHTRRDWTRDFGSDPRVDGFGVEWTQETEDREADRAECTVGLAVRHKLNGTSNSDLDPLHELVREITNYLNRRELAGLSVEQEWQGFEFPVVLSDEGLEKNRFFSVALITYVLVG